MRERIRATIETIVEQELKSALGATQSQRVGHQASLPNEEAVLLLLFGLLRSGQSPCAGSSAGRI